MARLTAAERNALPDSDFAGPDRTYPVPDEGHAKAAKGRASEFAGPALKAKIGRKVKARFGFADGGKAESGKSSRDDDENDATDEATAQYEASQVVERDEARKRSGRKDGGNVMARKRPKEGSAAEEAGESPAVEKAEQRKGFSDGGIAQAADKLNLKPTPGDEGPANDKRDHPMSASMKSALKGYPNL